jgi:hypothetical protein
MERRWVAAVPPERFATERLYAFDVLVLTTGAPAGPAGGPAPGDPVALVATTEPAVLFGLGRVRGGPAGAAVTIAYTHRLFDEPLPVSRAVVPGLTEVPPAEYDALVAAVGADRRTDADRSEWFVSVALPIEASSRAEAVREFWTYVDRLGPRELPAFVWPRGDELAMQAFVLGAEANQDPEEDES